MFFRNKTHFLNKLLILMFLILLFGLLVESVYAEKVEVDIEYYGVEACISCLKAEKYIEDTIVELEKQGYKINLNKHDIMDKTQEKNLIALNNALSIKGEQYKLIPAIFIGDSYLIDVDEIKTELKGLIIESANNGYNTVEIENTNFKTESFTMGAVFLAGLIDGINPCSIAMMLFFISIVMSDINNKKRFSALKLGFSFVLGVFTAYLGIGIGIFNFVYALSNIKDLMLIFYMALLIMAVVLCIVNIMDYINIKKGNEGKIKNQLNKKTKKKIHTFIKGSNEKSNKIYIMAFIVAFSISFMEFFCTGQIYLPTITYMIENSADFNYVFLLVIYNLAFVIPLILISVLLETGREIIDISTVLVDKLHLIKLMGALFFIIVIIYSLYQIQILI